jgi:poly(A) polymerase
MKIETKIINESELASTFAAFSFAGFQLLYVGGCVRNSILGYGQTDVDLATDATPAQMREIAKALSIRIIPTGEAFGTLTFQIAAQDFEITSFRNDVRTDGRRVEVLFGSSIQEDAARRDFTLNALYADVNGTVIDPLGGLADLREHRIRFIGNAEQRIKEDYLRILRFFRFLAWYGNAQSGIDPEGLSACASLCLGLGIVSKERIGVELLKLLAAPDPAPAMAAMEASGVLQIILPGACARNLALLVDLERDLKPDALRRLALVGGENLKMNLRLGNTALKRVLKLRKTAQECDRLIEHGYHLGEEDGWNSWLVRNAFFERTPDEYDRATIARAAKSQFPIQASDLVEFFSNKVLGEALEDGRRIWLASDMKLGKDVLISQIRENKIL